VCNLFDLNRVLLIKRFLQFSCATPRTTDINCQFGRIKTHAVASQRFWQHILELNHSEAIRLGNTSAKFPGIGYASL
jgi:hypothetical protein